MELENIRVHQGDEVEEVSPAGGDAVVGDNDNASDQSNDALELEWNKVSLSHGNKNILFGVSGRVKGKFLAIMGGSGSGKV